MVVEHTGQGNVALKESEAVVGFNSRGAGKGVNSLTTAGYLL